MMNFDNLEHHLGLHKNVTILYVVNGYDAILYAEEGYPEITIVGHGETIAQALQNLDLNLID